MKTLFFGLALAGLSILVYATPGAVDEYDCHRDFETNQYHCHGTEDEAQQVHILLGVTNKNDTWLYSNGPLNHFSGGAFEMEFASGTVAFHAGYGYQTHLTGAADYTLTGWDAGLKAGPSIARLGLHPYAELGYFSQTFRLPNLLAYPYSGIQYGGGFVWNFKKTAFDVRVLNKTVSDLQLVWTQLGAPGLTTNLSVQFGAYLRF